MKAPFDFFQIFLQSFFPETRPERGRRGVHGGVPAGVPERRDDQRVRGNVHQRQPLRCHRCRRRRCRRPMSFRRRYCVTVFRENSAAAKKCFAI